MDKISIDDVVNTDELPLINYLECPIDNLISMTPVMCKKCETCFCQDCIDNWKKKSTVCPMRCNPLELMNIDKSILKQQLDKIRLPCVNYNLGCLAKLLVKEVAGHEKLCEYKGVKCEKCQETIPAIGLLLHLYESCKKNVINCFICNTSLNLSDILSHIQKCETASAVCPVCIQPVTENIDLHGKICSLKLIQCQICKLPEIQSEIICGNHRCLMDSDLTNLNTYLKSLQSKYELSVNEIITKHDEKYNDFLKKFGDVNNEILKRENEKCTKLEHKLARLSDDYLKKMFSLKKDKKENLSKLNHEVQELEKKIEMKSKEIEKIPQSVELQKSFFIKEYELKVDAKIQNLEFLRNLIVNNKIKEETKKNSNLNQATQITNDINNSNIISLMDIDFSNSNSILIHDNRDEMGESNLNNQVINCKQCKIQLSDTSTNKCGFCSSALCRSCVIQCSNKNYDHAINTYCKECLTQCSLCLEYKQCKSCIKKCFYKSCNNVLCNSCYDRNKHQLRPINTICKFYKCDACQTDSNCILTTVYCAKCDRRVCKNCYHSSHKDHMNLK